MQHEDISVIINLTLFFALQYLAYTCGLIRGALSNLGLEGVVTAEVSLMPSCEHQIHVFIIYINIENNIETQSHHINLHHPVSLE